MTLPKRRPFKLTEPRSPLEHDIQKQIADALTIDIAPPGRVSRSGVVWWAVDAADYGGDVPGTRMGRGLVAGVPDLLVIHNGRAFFIEIKRPDSGVLSDAQKSVLAALFVASAHIGVATTVEQVLQCLDGWGIPRKHRVRLSA